METYKEDQILKTLTRRIISNKRDYQLLNQPRKLTEKIAKNNTRNLSDEFLSSELLDKPIDKNPLFNKQLLKNIKKTRQLNNTEEEIKSHQESLSLFSSINIKKPQKIGYRNIKLLRSFLTDYKKIKSRRLTKLTLKQQRQLSKSVKRARTLKLFDPRKTLKPQKFLNLERKNETLNVLLLLQILKFNKFVKLLRNIDSSKIMNVIQCLELVKIFDI